MAALPLQPPVYLLIVLCQGYNRQVKGLYSREDIGTATISKLFKTALNR
jgi:hypothetical protein